jgi:ferredoxin--NADP+ reductase
VTTHAQAADPILPEAKMHLVPVTAPVTGRIVSNDLCMKGKSASFVRHTVIDISGTPLAGNFLSGQSFGVIPPGVDEHGKPHKVRLYSIACPTWGEDGGGNVFSTTPKRVIEEFKPQKPGDDETRHDLFLGVCSNYLCDLRPGDEVKVTGPNGKRFILPVNVDDHDFLFIATGTGIAPFRGFAMELLERAVERGGPCRSQIHLLMGTPYTTDLLYDDVFTRLAKSHQNFKYWTAISREPRPGSSRGIYVDQIISENIDSFRDLLASPRTLIYVCGLAGMQFGLFQCLAEHGLGDGYLTVHEELKDTSPRQWKPDQMKRRVHATRRMMLEVY